MVRAAKVSPAASDSSPPVTAWPNYAGIKNSAHMVPLSSRASLQVSLHRDGSPCSSNPWSSSAVSLLDTMLPVLSCQCSHPFRLEQGQGGARPQGLAAPAVPGSSITRSLPVPDLSL